MKDLKSIFDLIDYEQFRKIPELFLIEKSISRLKTFMSGYFACEDFNQIKADSKPPFWLFFHYVCKFYNHNGSYHNWDGIILQNCNNDKKKALEEFFKRFDEFRKIQPLKGLISNINSESLKFYNSRMEKIEFEVDTKLGREVVDQFIIIKYDHDFGCEIYYLNEKQKVRPFFYRTIDETFQHFEREYGNSLEWSELSEANIDMKLSRYNY